MADDAYQRYFGDFYDAVYQRVEDDEEADEIPMPPVQRRIPYRRTINRDHVGAHRRLMEDYFEEDARYPLEIFRRRFRMSRRLFLQISTELAARYNCFRLRHDASGRPGLSTLQKCTAAIRQLAYGGPADMFDEYLQMGETTGLQVLKQFCRGLKAIFGATYLRKPTPDDCQLLLNMHNMKHGFPGMMGSIDCMHWEWRNCPSAWKGQFTTGFKGRHPTMILEAVADYRLWIWHAYFGVAGSNNDKNVLDSSPIFNDQCRGRGPQISFVANGKQHNMGYYLSDGIYPKWPVFLKSIKEPHGPKNQYFAQRQESARKDVERAFGVLQSRWAVLRNAVRSWHQDEVADIMYACIILHNMIIDDEGPDVERWTPAENGAGSSQGVATAPIQMGVPQTSAQLLRAWTDMRTEQQHFALQVDMVEELWARRIAVQD